MLKNPFLHGQVLLILEWSNLCVYSVSQDVHLDDVISQVEQAKSHILHSASPISKNYFLHIQLVFCNSRNFLSSQEVHSSILLLHVLHE